MPASVFRVHDATIQVLSNLSSAFETEFMDAVAELLAADHEKVILDFSAIHYISSTTIGLIVAAAAKASEAEVPIKILVSRAIRNILITCGVASMLELEVV